MEIREHLSVYLESGYLFDDMSGKLKWFEIDKILISFTYGVVRYVGTWGGCRAENVLKRIRASLRQNYQYMMFLSHYTDSLQ